ncbi:MAG: 2-oxo acid dehydrogenase subunit E2, partial [Acidimicrobiales bacterium]
AAPPAAPAAPAASAAPAAPPAGGEPGGNGMPPPPPDGYVARPAPTAAPFPAGDLLLSPVVRRLLSENGLSPSEVSGTGAGGRITRQDVLGMIDARRGGPVAAAPAAPPAAPAAAPAAPTYATPAAPPTAPAPPPAPAAPTYAPPAAPPPAPPAPAPAAPTYATPAVPSPAAAGPGTAVMRSYSDRVVPFSNMRRRTAEHMVRSKATSPHAFIAYEVDFENVDRVRRAWGERFRAEEGFSLTYLPFVARATVEALRDHPQLNASVVEDSLVVHQQINLGIAVDLNHEGLIVPVVHRAEEVTLRGIARRVRDLADRARSRQLTADDIAGGTFSITNDGPFGTYFTVPIINQPQVAILATDGIRRRPVVLTAVDGSESLAIHSAGIVGMSWDHRAVDGAYVSSFLRRLAEVLDTRDWSAEL